MSLFLPRHLRCRVVSVSLSETLFVLADGPSDHL
jgi:hypothetical protein